MQTHGAYGRDSRNDTGNLRYSNALCVASNIGNSSGLFWEKLVFRQNGLVV